MTARAKNGDERIMDGKEDFTGAPFGYAQGSVGMMCEGVEHRAIGIFGRNG